MFSVEQASITVSVSVKLTVHIKPDQRTIETLLVGHVSALRELPGRVIVKDVVPGYTLVGGAQASHASP